MARAEIVLPSGAKVNIEGSDEEIRRLLDAYALPAAQEGHRRPSPANPVVRPRKVEGPTAHIRRLRAEGFFNIKRPLSAVVHRLAEEGHIYPQTTLSPLLIKLTKNRELRRMKEKGVWVYVNP